MLIFSRELKDFRLILDMGKRLSLLVTLQMNHRLVINIAFLFTTEQRFFFNQRDSNCKCPHNAEFGHFTLFCRGRQRNVPRIITHEHSHCIAHENFF